jgi:starvation-inducible DNA-binding protein
MFSPEPPMSRAGGIFRTKPTAMHATKNSLPPETRKKIAGLLNPILADLSDLRSQTKQAHWNLRGPQFRALHLFFDELAETLLAHADTVAERITQLGGTARGTVRMAAEGSRLKEFPDNAFHDMACVAALAERYAACGKSVRDGISTADDLDDAGTADHLTKVAQDLDEALWMLEAHEPKEGK